MEIDQGSSSTSETGRYTATFTNTSGSTCHLWSTSARSSIVDTRGETVALFPTEVSDSLTPVPVRPGQVFTRSQAWPDDLCPSQCPLGPGSYELVVEMEPFGVVRRGMTLLPVG